MLGLESLKDCNVYMGKAAAKITRCPKDHVIIDSSAECQKYEQIKFISDYVYSFHEKIQDISFCFRHCPENYVCLRVGGNPNHGFTNFDNFLWSMLTTFQLITLDYWENVYNMVSII